MIHEDEQTCCMCGDSCTTGVEAGGQVICMVCADSIDIFASDEAEKNAEFSEFLEDNDLEGVDLDSGEFY